MDAPRDTPAAWTPLVSPYCARLRSKKLYAATEPPRTREDVLDGSGHCWCARTMLALGPDEGRVDPDACRAGRACYESVLSAGPAGPAVG